MSTMKFTLHYPAKPYKLNQAWGIYSVIYKQFGFSLHNGLDIALGHDKKIRAPIDGQVVKVGYQPNGGGVFFGLISKEFYEFGDGKVCQVLLDFLHLEKTLCVEGKDYEAGDVLAIADNTGFSSGMHTHIQARRVSWDGISIQTIDQNQANNSFDLVPYFTGEYAEDIGNLKQQITLYQKIVVLLKQLLNI